MFWFGGFQNGLLGSDSEGRAGHGRATGAVGEPVSEPVWIDEVVSEIVSAVAADLLRLRASLKDRVSDSTLGPKLFETAALAKAAWARTGRSGFREAELLLRAWRLLGSARVSGATRRRVEALIRAFCFAGGELLPVAQNRFLHDYAHGSEARRTRARDAAAPVADRVRMRNPKGSQDPERQGNVMVLKAHDAETGEKGVLFLKYGTTFRWFAASFDVPAVADRYAIALEPSVWGYQDASFLLYLGAGFDVVVLAQRREDYEFIRDLECNLVPIRLGAGDWVDPATFQPGRSVREYDVVMVAQWHPLKRHALLFSSLAKLRAAGRVLRVALVGYQSMWKRADIERLMRRFGVHDQCTIFEGLPHSEVGRVVGESKCSLVLSRREGANKALYESLFSGTPLIVYRHQVGVNLDVITDQVGVLADDEELPDAMLHVVDGWREFRPREWATAHTGWINATRCLNDVLRGLAERSGRPWTRDIVGKKNTPNLWYAEPGTHRTFEAEYARLARYLRASGARERTAVAHWDAEPAAQLALDDPPRPRSATRESV